MNKQKILIVDDTAENLDILFELLNDYDIIDAISAKEAFEILDEENVDLILLDIMMPDMDGYEVCRILKNNTETEDIPIIFITAITDEESIEKAYNQGGNDYVTKPFKPKELLARVKTQLKVQSLIKHLDRLASYDQLSGIYNRRKFFELAKERFLNDKNNLYAIMIDIDNFKNVNDTYGHATGDSVIKTFASVISSHLEKEAIFGRVGGEEFTIISHFENSETVILFAEKFRTAIEKTKVIANDGSAFHFTISCGISAYRKDLEILDDLLKEADKALYDAKGYGRNRAIFRS